MEGKKAGVGGGAKAAEDISEAAARTLEGRDGRPAGQSVWTRPNLSILFHRRNAEAEPRIGFPNPRISLGIAPVKRESRLRVDGV
jgi:hypothetical protein